MIPVPAEAEKNIKNAAAGTHKIKEQYALFL